MRPLAFTITLLVACSSSKSPNELPGDGLTVAEYEQAGVPAIDHVWTIDEHTAAAIALAKLAEGHREQLPREGGAKSGALFAKLVERTPDDPSKPVSERFVAHAMRYEAANQAGKLYIVNVMAAPSREWLALAGLLLDESAALFVLADAFLAQFPPDDPSRVTREAGWAKIRAGSTGLLLGALMVTADVRITEPARVTLAKQLAHAFPVIYPKLEDAQQGQLRGQLGKLLDALKSGPLRDALPALP